MNWRDYFSPFVIASGLAIGVTAAILVRLGNPPNMGICMACFERDIAGALGFHRAEAVQYLRPEIFAIVIGAFCAAVLSREAVPRSGSSPLLRFLLGAFVMIGALVFLGCPTRMVLRIAGGDGNALLGLGGFVAGIAAGCVLLRRGSTFGVASRERVGVSHLAMPVLAVGGLVLLIVSPSFIFKSESGPGSMHAPAAASIAAGLIVGVLGQRSRLCFAGGIRDMILFKSPYLLTGFTAVFAGALAANVVLGQFNAGFAGQPVAHTSHVWNLLGMVLVGLGSTLLGGCPFRQLVLASQGNGDSALTVLGMVAGAAVAHNFGLAASPAGVSGAAMIAVLLGLAFCVIAGLLSRDR